MENVAKARNKFHRKVTRGIHKDKPEAQSDLLQRAALTAYLELQSR